MADGKIGILTAFWRFVSFYNLRKGRQIADAADAQFTGSVQGIKAGYDIHADQLVTRFKDLRDATATFETAIETKKQRAGGLKDKIEKKERALSGALVAIEKAQAAKDTTAENAARTDAAQFKKEADDLHTELDSVTAELAAAETRREKLFRQLQDLKKEIEGLGAEKAEAIAQFITNKQLLETLDRLDNLTTAVDRGPIDAIRKSNQELAARTNVAERLHEATSTDREKQYLEQGTTADANDAINAMLAARKSKREEQTGEGQQTADREKI
ncbi:MAG TPA: hypothetical protein V6C81_12180 [Planktothrix sp.]|jgi:chromosome segregation ATPase